MHRNPNRVSRFLSAIEWRWSLGALVWSLVIPTTSFALPAWATWAAQVFSESAPLSWVVAGFCGLFVYAICVALYGFGRHKTIRSRYDERFLRQTGGVDPLAKVFEGKRIFLNDFILPSNPAVDGKTFVDCEIVGPANIFLAFDNKIDEIKTEKVDAVALSIENPFLNGFTFRGCTFRGCTFHRITLFIHPSEVPSIIDLQWLNWIAELPAQSNLKLTHETHPSQETEASNASTL